MRSFVELVFLLIGVSSFAQPFPDSEKDGRYITVNGAKLWVVTVGKGDPMILVPGGPGGVHLGLRRFDTLAKNHQLIYFDGFGRGKSDTAKQLSEYTLERDIEDIEGLRVALRFDKINLLGHSYGGLVAQGYAIKYPSRVKHLVLANTFHSFLMWQKNDDNSNHEIRTNYPEVWDSLMKIRERGYVSADQLHQDIYGLVPYGFLYAYNPEHFKVRGAKPYPNRMNTRLYYQMVGRDGDFIVGNDIGNFDFRKQLASLKMPVLIYGGRYDRVAVPEMMVKYKTYCPQAQFVMFEQSGHNPHVEEPGKLFPLLQSFLKQ
ncbi:alpha/beta fold hydrolase [Segetibacter sp. 3557_3]|uniref:alpha/beta fold hydrolase n=1 Tax=Segetibacter sp. 3557_3 TaxID=2547429 RepID=UPI0010586E1B|nr:alpha/beta hydrolase [Segetibacter sp. 3557_3]TDH22979.1 alpha/beta fold hydrolase [Segetibacter sp. 3557_3]